MNDTVFLYEPSLEDFDYVHTSQARSLRDLYTAHATGVQYWDGIIDPVAPEFDRWISTHNIGKAVVVCVWVDDSIYPTELIWPDAPTLVAYLEEVLSYD